MTQYLPNTYPQRGIRVDSCCVARQANVYHLHRNWIRQGMPIDRCERKGQTQRDHVANMSRVNGLSHLDRQFVHSYCLVRTTWFRYKVYIYGLHCSRLKESLADKYSKSFKEIMKVNWKWWTAGDRSIDAPQSRTPYVFVGQPCHRRHRQCVQEHSICP